MMEKFARLGLSGKYPPAKPGDTYECAKQVKAALRPAGNNKATASGGFFVWRPHGDSNPGYRRERAMS